MRKEGKNQIIDTLAEEIKSNNHFYLADISGFDVETTSKLRRACYKNNIKLKVVKNTLLRKAMEKFDGKFESFYDVLIGSTSIIFSETGNTPAKVIKSFRKNNAKPLIKGAYVQEGIYIGDSQLEILINLKSKEEVIGDIIMLLQSPVKNVVSALQSNSSFKIAGIIKTLSDKKE